MEIHEKYKKGKNRVEYIDDIKVIRNGFMFQNQKVLFPDCSIISALFGPAIGEEEN